LVKIQRALNLYNNLLGDSMKYQIISAEKEHTSSLPGIERAAAQTFSPEDLPEPLRSEPTVETEFLEAQALDQLWVVVDDEESPPRESPLPI